ncbi:MAG: hypothetical protein PHI34_08685 [Acidobacteriota bacterium]|nr:hypothetical protein [Acidobacteriota bacterium]
MRRRVRPGRPAAATGLLVLAILTAAVPPRLQAQTPVLWTKPQAALAAELGMDNLDRRFYRPTFSFAWPFALAGGGRFKLDVSYLQRMNGDLQGTIDYWVRAGAEKRISDAVSFEAVLNHFCRHQSSIANPYVLNLNELMGRVVVRAEGWTLGAGFGPYIGGSGGYESLAAFSLDASPFILPEASFSGEVKWVDFERFYYEATLTVGLGNGVEVFLRAARHYDFPAAAYLGLRFRSDGPLARYVDDFNATAGVYPYYGTHKLLAIGNYRLMFVRQEDRRFLTAIEFQTPLLSGDGFLDQFWPDRMLHSASAEYERTLPGGMRAAWYARYVIDMPVDKALRFRSHWATGLLLRNQSEFERLDKPIRFEAAVGYDFAFDYDARLKLGANARILRGKAAAGAEFVIEANAEQQSAHAKAFLSFGRTIETRPFIGIRKVTYLTGGPGTPDPFRSSLIFGVTFLKWREEN